MFNFEMCKKLQKTLQKGLDDSKKGHFFAPALEIERRSNKNM